MRAFDINSFIGYNAESSYKTDWIKLNDLIGWLDERFDYDKEEYNIKFKPINYPKKTLRVLMLKHDDAAMLTKLQFPFLKEIKTKDYETF